MYVGIPTTRYARPTRSWSSRSTGKRMPRASTAFATISLDSLKSSPRICSFPASGSVVIALISGMAALHSGHHVAQKTRRTGFFPRYRPSVTGRPSRSGRVKSVDRSLSAMPVAGFPPPPGRRRSGPARAAPHSRNSSTAMAYRDLIVPRLEEQVLARQQEQDAERPLDLHRPPSRLRKVCQYPRERPEGHDGNPHPQREGEQESRAEDGVPARPDVEQPPTVARRLAEPPPGQPRRHPEGGVRQGHPDRVGGGQEERAAAGPPAAASDISDRHGEDRVDARGEADEDPPEERRGVREGGARLEVRLEGGEERSHYTDGPRVDGLLEERKDRVRLHGTD